MNEASIEDWNGKLHVSNTSVDADKLLASLQKRIVVDIDAQACTEALAGLSAYYKCWRLRILLILHAWLLACLIGYLHEGAR